MPKKTTWWRLLRACWQGKIAKIAARKQRNCKKHIWVYAPYQLYPEYLECLLCGAYSE